MTTLTKKSRQRCRAFACNLIGKIEEPQSECMARIVSGFEATSALPIMKMIQEESRLKHDELGAWLRNRIEGNRGTPYPFKMVRGPFTGSSLVDPNPVDLTAVTSTSETGATEFTSGAQITAWYIGLMNATPTVAAGDTMGSHAGWTEYTSYSQATRVAYTGVESGQAVTNSASPAIFTVNAGSTTVGGAFITSGSAISGSTGTLGPEAAFTGGNRSPANGDQIVVTYSLSAASVN